MIVALARKLLIALWRFVTTANIGGRHLASGRLKASGYFYSALAQDSARTAD